VVPRVPVFLVPLHEFNTCHNPTGAGGGQFCSADGGGGGGQDKPTSGRVYKSQGERDAAEGRVDHATPDAFKAALQRNTRAETLSDYSSEELGHMRLFLLKGGQAGYALKPDGELVNLFNSGKAETAGAGAWLVIHAIEQGATRGDHFDGFLTEYYERLGFTHVRREPNWTPGGKDVLFMEYAGGDRKTARARYRQHGRIDAS
jgi:hypothetical protein